MTSFQDLKNANSKTRKIAEDLIDKNEELAKQLQDHSQQLARYKQAYQQLQSTVSMTNLRTKLLDIASRQKIGTAILGPKKAQILIARAKALEEYVLSDAEIPDSPDSNNTTNNE